MPKYLLFTLVLGSCGEYEDPYGEPYSSYDESVQGLPKYPTVFVNDSGDYGDTLYWCNDFGIRYLCLEIAQRQEGLPPQNNGDIDPVP